MRVNLFVAIVCLIIAIIMYILPDTVLQQFKLTVFDLYLSINGEVESRFNFPSDESSGLIISDEEEVQELNRILMSKDAEIAFLKKELRQLADFHELFPHIKIVTANIIGESASEVSPELIIDRGEADGVKNGAGIAQGSVIAGVVVNAEEKASLVLRADNPGVLIPARAAKSRDRCSVKGDGNERALAIFYTGQTSAMIGEKIFTSSALGKIPEGLLVGVLEDYPHKGKEPGTLEAPVKLDADFASLERVIVISEF